MNGCRQNESPNSWSKHHNNPHDSSSSINILKSENLHVCNKPIKLLLLFSLVNGAWAVYIFILILTKQSCGLFVDFCEVFNSCLNSHSDGTHSLQSFHCWASESAKFLQSCSDDKTNVSTSWMASIFSAILGGIIGSLIYNLVFWSVFKKNRFFFPNYVNSIRKFKQ